MVEDQPVEKIRLNKFIAQHLAIGRRQADDLISRGDVLLNGQPATLGDRVQPGFDTITVSGKAIKQSKETTFVYLALNKPAGYVSSRRQQGDNPTIYALIPKEYHHLKPVGRLDKDSSGLLLLTNDGDFTHRMTHPSFAKTKQYEVTLGRPLEPLHRQMINDHGVQLEDGGSRLQLDRLNDGNETEWLVTMHEGRNRQIRRTFGSLRYSVKRLHRIKFGNYELNDQLQPGSFVEIPVVQ
ncbi:ribosomal large subunit pseudouridine synthase B [Candidatus Saccharibacteria bacterium]|nr:MAG: ribosomal large subunit pseudouridine synthase B [Candidatus Saccharibacteria bacterium]